MSVRACMSVCERERALNALLMRLPSVPEAKRWLVPSLHLTGCRVSYELLLIKRTNYSPLLSATFIGQRCNLGFINEDVTLYKE